MATVHSIFIKEWLVMMIAVGTLLLTIFPLYLKRKFKIHISHSFVSFSAVFIYATIFLGEVHGFYDTFWWWDLLWHLYSATGLGLIGVALLLSIMEKKGARSSPYIFSLFIFCFAVTIGTIWEIFEFSMDSTFGLNMQKSGLRDTMSDLIIDTIGSGIASFGGYLYITKSRFSFLKDFIDQNHLVDKTKPSETLK